MNLDGREITDIFALILNRKEGLVIFFTSDTHLGHALILLHDNRPFKTIKEHDTAIIDNWNSVVGPKDDVYHLGDFCFRSDKSVGWYIDQLRGRIHLIRGNHDDKEAWRKRNLFSSAHEAKYIRIDNEKIFMLHYACRVWRNSHHGSWHLFGHSHGHLNEAIQGTRSLDMWVGGHDYKPWSFDEVKAYMANKPVTNHHEE